MKKFCFLKASSFLKKAISVICALCVIISVVVIVPIIANAEDDVVTSLSTKAKMLMFVGKTSASGGGNGSIQQDIQLESGKKYQLSFFVKYGGTGIEGDKIGAELQYKKDGSFVALDSTKNTDTKYLETYTFTMPSDAQSGTNFKLSFYGSSAFTSGYVTNFKLFEIGSDGKVSGDNLVQNGDFSTGSASKWTKSGEFLRFDFGNIPENFFHPEIEHTPNMIIYRNPSDYAQFSYSPQLKPATKYEMVYQDLHIELGKDDGPVVPIWLFYTNELGESVNNSIDIEKVVDGAYTHGYFTTYETLRTTASNNAIIRYYMRSGSAGYWGAIELYELDDNGNRVSNNLIINGDFTNDIKFWSTSGECTYRIVEDKDFFENWKAPEEMINSLGTLADQTYGQTLKLDPKKEYYLSGYYVNMNSEGITPQIQYLPKAAKGTQNFEDIEVEMFYDSDRYYFETSFKAPRDAAITGGMTDIRIQFNNKDKGKFYLADVRLCEAGKYDNLLTDMTYADNGNFETIPYNEGVFVFYYDDKLFDDGDWSGEYTITYGTLTGRVVDTEGKGIAGKVLQLGSEKLTVKTDENGEYSFDQVDPDTYKLYILDKDNKQIYCSDVTVKKAIWGIMPTITFTEAVTTVTTIEPEDTTDSTTSDTTEPEEAFGMLRGYYYDRQGNVIKGASISVRGVGSAVTDDKGMFMFDKIPEGKYDLYTKLEDGSEHVFRQVDVKANKGMQVKIMKPAQEEETGTPWVMILIISGAVMVCAVIALTVILLAKKKK